MLCLAAPERGLGITIASDDGMPRGLGPAAIATLEQLGLADDAALCALRERYAGAVPSFKGEPVGAVRTALQLQVA
ncbi:MAG: asparaginase [Chloroflexi bacterium]|nr:asparaginase [Chloroflexota bacterium]